MILKNAEKPENRESEVDLYILKSYNKYILIYFINERECVNEKI